MHRKGLGILLLVGCGFFGCLCYGSLAIVHYDVDPFTVLASLLNISVETLGYISGGISIICLGSGLWLLFQK